MQKATQNFVGSLLALPVIAMSTMGLLATEEPSRNEALTPLYRAATKGLASDNEQSELQRATLEIYRQGGIQAAEDLYRAGSILLGSEEVADLHLAHDFGVAAMHHGFQPAQKLVLSAQTKLLEKLGLDDLEIEPVGEFSPIGSPSNFKNGRAQIMEAISDAPTAATTAVIFAPIEARR